VLIEILTTKSERSRKTEWKILVSLEQEKRIKSIRKRFKIMEKKNVR